MLEKTLVRQCAPTLAGLKTGSLFSVAAPSDRELYQWLKSLNRRLGPKGLRLLPVRRRGERVLLYLYRGELLRRDLEDQSACRMLEGLGYPCPRAGQCVARMVRRVRERPDFPHEVGLFLGYPPEDVRGFMERRDCKLVGCWKVYGDEQKAQETFRRYRQCTAAYCQRWRGGASLEQLAQAENG
ncbi:MAG: DUF3793 family protein [Oscillospiraceae bacterium]|nr:DUF3793 family protein [Oscillospiraceae bacterium]